MFPTPAPFHTQRIRCTSGNLYIYRYIYVIRLTSAAVVPFLGAPACDWWHGVPQLFWRDGNVRVALPGSCARVELVPVEI